MVFEGTQNQIASSFMLSKGLILYMIKGVQEECQEQKQAKGEDEGQLDGDA